MDFEKIQITQHAIDRFLVRCLKGKKGALRLYADQYYKDLILTYLKDAVEIEIPLQHQILKAMKYKGELTRHFLNRREKILFVIVNDDILVTVHCPFDDSKRFQKRSSKSMFKTKKKRKR